jgi:alpha-glucosidase
MARAMVVPVVGGILLVLAAQTAFGQTAWKVTSPDDKVTLAVRLADPGQVADYPTGKVRLYYEVLCGNAVVLPLSPLGITRDDQDFVDGLRFVSASSVRTIDETYTMLHGKRKVCRDHAREQTLTFQNPNGARLELILRAYDDGAAYRYRFPESSDRTHTMTREASGFRLPKGGKVWAHPYDRASQYTPAYETYWVNGVEVGTASPNEEGWAFPLLFCTSDGDRWALITEAALDGSYCGSHLSQPTRGGVHWLQFPAPGEGHGTGEVEPSWTLPWATPWRVVIVGETLAPIVESTLVTNLNPPSIVEDASWIRPGRASWSWLSDHDSPQDHDKLETFIDLAAEMTWEFSLVDANWNIMKKGTIHDLLAHAEDQGVGLLLWYNSGGPHNVVTEQPRGTMDLRPVRRYEFRRLRDWGVKGVKVDFFQSDKQNIIQLYHDILKDAADFQIMVNFHGCTLPRGWSRTYPHLMTMEAVRGAECYSFDRSFTEYAPMHNTVIPFTRNAVGPMDYTPTMFDDNVYKHITTNTHEIALPIVFESGWLHFADRVSAYRDLPEVAKQFLRTVPVTWDETKFLAGRPGECVALARRHGDTWYLGAISGQKSERSVQVPLSFLAGDVKYTSLVIADGQTPRRLNAAISKPQAGEYSRFTGVTSKDSVDIDFLPYGGYVAVFAPAK